MKAKTSNKVIDGVQRKVENKSNAPRKAPRRNIAPKQSRE